MWLAKFSTAIGLSQGSVWIDILLLVLPCAIAGIVMAYFSRLVTFTAGCVGGWFLARLICGAIGVFATKDDDISGANIGW